MGPQFVGPLKGGTAMAEFVPVCRLDEIPVGEVAEVVGWAGGPVEHLLPKHLDLSAVLP